MKYTSIDEALQNPEEAVELEVFEYLKEIPDLRSLVNLEILSFAGCRAIYTLPEWLLELKNLKVLNMHGNLVREFPQSLTGMGSLKDLDLSSNQVVELPDLSSMNLERLDVSYNPINSLPELPPLKELVLVEGGFPDPDQMVQRICRSCPDLEVLYLDEIELTRLPDEIGNLKKLKELNISNNHITELPESFFSLPNLVDLNLEENVHEETFEMSFLNDEIRTKLRETFPDAQIEF